MSEKIESNKGYLNLTGKIIALNNKKVKESPRSREVSFGIQTAKDHVVFVRAFGFLKEDDDTILVEYYDENKKRQTKKDIYSNVEWLAEGETVVGTKLKFTTDGEVISCVDVDAIDKLMTGFKDGDTVTVSLATEVDTYFNSLKFDVRKMYASSKEVNFEDVAYEEECHGRQWISLNKVEKNEVKAFLFNKKEEAVELTFDLNTNYIKPEDFAEFKQGQLLQAEFEYSKRPIYSEVTEEPKKDEKKFVPKGKYAKEVNDRGNNYQQISGYEEKFILTGISNVNETVIDLQKYLLTDDAGEETPFN